MEGGGGRWLTAVLCQAVPAVTPVINICVNILRNDIIFVLFDSPLLSLNETNFCRKDE